MFKYVCPSELMMSIKDEEEPQTEVRKSIVIESTPEVIFKAITNQSELTNWLPVSFHPRTENRWKNLR